MMPTDRPVPPDIDQVRANRSPADISAACIVALPVWPESSIIKVVAANKLQDILSYGLDLIGRDERLFQSLRAAGD